jgi:hypothetical protein
MSDPAAMAQASVADLSHVLTTCLRADRFCDGYLAEAFEAGLIAHSDDCSHRFRSKPATCSDRSQPGIPMIPAG